jgi:hypothetical protein
MVDRGLVSKRYAKRPLPFWAIVDAILDLSAAAKRALAEEYSNSMNFSDGVIYRNINEYTSLGDKFAEFQWWARLTKCKKDILKQFLKHAFCAHFNSLLIIHGLWIAFNIGTLHKMMAMKVDEVSN